MPITTSPGMELIGKSALDLFTDGQVQSECIVALAKKYPSLAAMTPWICRWRPRRSAAR